MNEITDSLLTLFNKFGEAYQAGPIRTYTKTNSKTKIRWICNDPMENNSPFTHAMVHTGKKIFSVNSIVPVEVGDTPSEIELEFANA